MKLHVDDNMKISDLQDQFNAVFPFLKIELFKTSHQAGEPSRKEDMLNSNESIQNCRTKHNDGDITIIGENTVQEVERAFQENFGISVQVFRKSGKVWLVTTTTDSWTLAEQNNHGSLKE